MNKLIIGGILLMILGGGLAIKGHFTEQTTRGHEILGTEFTTTDNERKTIPQWVSASLLGVGAILAVIGALQGKNIVKSK